jgi:hypothetical protein
MYSNSCNTILLWCPSVGADRRPFYWPEKYGCPCPAEVRASTAVHNRQDCKDHTTAGSSTSARLSHPFHVADLPSCNGFLSHTDEELSGACPVGPWRRLNRASSRKCLWHAKTRIKRSGLGTFAMITLNVGQMCKDTPRACYFRHGLENQRTVLRLSSSCCPTKSRDTREQAGRENCGTDFDYSRVFRRSVANR